MGDTHAEESPDWVNLSKRGGNDGVFLGLVGLAGLLRRISRGQSLREIPRSSPASRIGPPQVTLNFLPPEYHIPWILVYHGYYAR